MGDNRATVTHQRLVSILMALGLGVANAAVAQTLIRAGGEFQVNTYTPNLQLYPAIAADAQGDFIVVWESYTEDRSAFGIFGRRFNSSGTPLASQFQVNVYTLANQREPAIAAAGNGDFVVVWTSTHDTGTPSVGTGVFARRFDANGVPQGAEIQVNQYTPGDQRRPAVAKDADGDFVVAWASSPGDGGHDGVFARRFGSSGAPLTAEFEAGDAAGGYSFPPAVASEPDGDFVVAWTNVGADGSEDGVFARRFDSAGVAQGGAFRAHAYTLNDQHAPNVAALPDGAFVIAWSSAYQDNFPTEGVFFRRVSASGVLGPEMQANVTGFGLQAFPAVAAAANGAFVIAWQSNSFPGDGNLAAASARTFGASSLPTSFDLQVNSYTIGPQYAVAVAHGPQGFVVAWNSSGQDDGEQFGSGVFAQRFALLADLDVDGNGSTDPLTDGLLTLRYHFGFTGAALTTGVIGNGCMRCTPEAILAYLQSQD